MNFGITLSNRGVLVGLCSARDLLVLADAVEASPVMDSVWCGDALFVNRRLDALTLLAAVAGRTERVLIGPACMGSFALRNPLVFAYEWASLDVLSNGRTRLVACAGGGAGPLWEAETAALGIAPGERRKRMIENIHVLRHLWSKDNAPFNGEFTRFSNVTLEPKPVQRPHPPIWVGGEGPAALRRTARVGNAWYPIGSNNQHLLDTLPRLRAGIARLRKATVDAGRDPASVEIGYRVKRYGAAVPPIASDGERRLFSGSEADIVGDLRALSELGVTALDIDFGRPDAAAVIAEMRRFRAAVIEKM